MTKIIAEVGLNHMGSLELAKKYIIEVAKTGVWGIKRKFMILIMKVLGGKFRIKCLISIKIDMIGKLSFSNNEWKNCIYYQKKII